MSIKEILSKANKYMTAESFENPELETRLLAEHVFGSNILLQRNVTKRELVHFSEHMKKLKRKIPIQRQIGYTLVRGKKINITPSVILPGQEIEMMIDAFFEYAKNPRKVVDLCTGCGVLASIISESFPAAKVYAIDISEEAIKVAKSNIRSHNVIFLAGDLFDPLRANEVYDIDVLISNPPYCKTRDISNLPRQIRDHTPRIAIDGGKDGYLFHRKIIDEAWNYLKRGGLLIVENEKGQSFKLRRMLGKIGYKIECTKRNNKGEERVIVARKVE